MWDFGVTTVALFLVVVLVVLWLSTRRAPGLPPGPPSLPFVGNALSMDSDPRVLFKNLRQKYGDIFSLYVFHKPLIVLNGYDVLKEAMVKNADVFSDRPHSSLMDFVTKGKGVIGTSGDLWHEQRRFALNALREFGVGRTIMEDKIHEEIAQFLLALEEQKGQGFNIQRLVQNAVSNIICSTVFGKRFEYTDPLFVRFLESLDENFQNTKATGVLNVFPVVRFLPGDPFKFTKTMDNINLVHNLLIQPSIKGHLNDHNEENRDDFIHVYLTEMRRRQQTQETTTLDLGNLARVIADLFTAGTETTSTTIRWALVYFLNYPDVQERCFQEILENVGQSRRPSMKDKTNLPYVEATILEALRYADIVPTAVPHAVPQDVQFRGYTFPKGVTVMLNLDSVLQDPDVWGDPQNFRPDRFLDGAGKIQKREEFIPFSLGRRVCLGEAMARMELFLFLTTMIQRFKFVPVNGKKPPMDGIMGFTHSPSEFQVKAIPRN
ncbi:LOW QUALITY PROTEIN: cytochrome P450 2U1-like [Haliotis rubra]|uniref:LOW QUALITY PROTEIN: cytochrome P450 2U1-like n=1 Tax=Haliotis rubra TaxID=36100 RepID=UPI001EE54F07|nr:LOW QUALITY PROTEIN: cytochrome P450 2U1-like [Haliotis rubra]